MDIQNNQACFVQLWRQLERTRRVLSSCYKRFSVRNVLKLWFGAEATDDFIWQVCKQTVVSDEQVCGNDLLLSPKYYPRIHRELLRAIVATKLGLGLRHVKLPDLDAAYSIAFPNSTPINVNKKKRKYGTYSTVEQ